MRKQKLLLTFISLSFFTCLLFAQTEDIYSSRRLKVMEALNGGIALFFTQTSSDELDKNFYYLTGIKEPNAALLLNPNGDLKEVLFTNSGEWGYVENNFSAKSYKSEIINRQISPFIRDVDLAYISFGNFESMSKFRRVLSGLNTLKNIDPIVTSLRVHKDDYEIRTLKKACTITAESLNDVYRAVKPGMTEEDLARILEFGYESRKSSGKSFLQAASGPNSVNIHFGATERVLQKGDIIVFDVGAYWNEYTSDISRTIPVSGRFTKEQKEIYNLVLNSQKAAIKEMVPGTKLTDVKKIAEDVLIDGLFKLGLIIDKNSEWQRRFFIQHGFYHFIGLDVHDIWYDYIRDRSEKIYEPGMIMTMEPGLYFPEGRLDSVPRRLERMVKEEEFNIFADKIRSNYNKYIHIGVRIEDDILITREGNVNLTAKVPKEVSDIEKMMKEKCPTEILNLIKN